jgi:hypothetical protein
MFETPKGFREFRVDQQGVHRMLLREEGRRAHNSAAGVLQMVPAHRKPTQLRSGALLHRTDCPTRHPKTVQKGSLRQKQQIFRIEALVAPGLANILCAQLISQNTTASGHQVEDQDDQRNHQQNVNQTTGNVEAEAQKPQNQNDDKNCPKHTFSFASRGSANIQIGSWTILHANSQ